MSGHNAMTTARDVIAETLKRWNIRATEKCAGEIVSALHSAGYVIIKDRTDPEGGIPGRKV